jgi:hypothetical protein
LREKHGGALFGHDIFASHKQNADIAGKSPLTVDKVDGGKNVRRKNPNLNKTLKAPLIFQIIGEF